jgi:hypothetical protein
MASTVGIFCKSYSRDFAHLHTLIDSFIAHNPAKLGLTLSLPRTDLAKFLDEFGSDIPDVVVVVDESYCDFDLKQFRGWHAQQICKLSSWRTMRADQYICVDSDCYFIKDIDPEELRPNPNKRHLLYGSFLRTVVSEGHDHLVRYINGTLPDFLITFPPRPTGVACKLADFLRFKDVDLDNPNAIERSAIPMQVFSVPKWVFYQPGQTFSREILMRLDDFVKSYGITVADLILISPWEYNWYGEFVTSQFYDNVEFRVSPFVHFQNRESIDFTRGRGIDEAQLSNRFLIVQMAAGHIKDLRF